MRSVFSFKEFRNDPRVFFVLTEKHTIWYYAKKVQWKKWKFHRSDERKIRGKIFFFFLSLAPISKEAIIDAKLRFLIFFLS